VRAAWWQEKQDEFVNRSRCRVAAHNRSLHARFAAVHHKTVGLLGLATKPRPEARRAETGSGHVEKLRWRRTRGRITGLASGGRGLQRWRGRAMKRSATWPISPEGLYHNLSARSSVVFCLARRGLIYIRSRVYRKTIHLDYFSFSLLHKVRFFLLL
jgi:hypothetical protein